MASYTENNNEASYAEIIEHYYRKRILEQCKRYGKVIIRPARGDDEGVIIKTRERWTRDLAETIKCYANIKTGEKELQRLDRMINSELALVGNGDFIVSFSISPPIAINSVEDMNYFM